MNFFSQNLRIDPFFTNMTHSKNSSLLNLFIWLKELNTFLNMTQRIGLVSKWLKELNLFFSKWLKEFNLFFSKWLKELNLFSQMTRRLDFSLSNMSDRNTFFWKKDDSKNWFSENINQIIQTLFWLKEFFFFKKITWLIEIELFSHDSKNWTLFWIWLENLNFFLNVTHRIELFYWLKEMSSFFFFQNDIDFVEYDSKNRTFVWICHQELNLFWNFTQWIEHSAQKDSKNWTLKRLFEQQNLLMNWGIGPFFYLTHRIELFFRTWLTELNFFFLEYDSLRLNPSFLLESKKMTPFLAWLKENFFSHIRLKEQWSFLWKYWPKDLIFVNRNIFLRIELFLKALTTNPFSQL